MTLKFLNFFNGCGYKNEKGRKKEKKGFWKVAFFYLSSFFVEFLRSFKEKTCNLKYWSKFGGCRYLRIKIVLNSWDWKLKNENYIDEIFVYNIRFKFRQHLFVLFICLSGLNDIWYF